MFVRWRMTAHPFTVSPSTTVPEAVEMMQTHNVRKLPVVSEGRLVGIISIGDLVKWKISEVEAEADGLKAYIATG